MVTKRKPIKRKPIKRRTRKGGLFYKINPDKSVHENQHNYFDIWRPLGWQVYNETTKQWTSGKYDRNMNFNNLDEKLETAINQWNWPGLTNPGMKPSVLTRKLMPTHRPCGDDAWKGIEDGRCQRLTNVYK